MLSLKSIVCCAWCLTGLVTAAQPVLQAEAFRQVSCEIYSMVAEPTAIAENGENVVWDISSYPMNHFGSLEIMPAAGTPFADSFASCNWVEYFQQFNGFEGYSYYILTDSLLELAGYAPFGPSNDPAYFVDPLFLLRFPFSWGDETIGTGQFQGETPMTSLWKYTAFGTLITSAGTCQNVVKLENLMNPGACSFWTSDPLVRVLEYANWTYFNIELPITSTGLDPDILPTTNSVQVMDGNTLAFASDASVQQYRIMDATGRMVRSSNRVVDPRIGVDVSSLVPGWYLFQFQTGGKFHSQRFLR
jgi:hypothetical protein